MGWPNSAGDAIDRQRLGHREPPAHAEARRVLLGRGKTVVGSPKHPSGIVRIDTEHLPGSIVYLGASGCVMTAWEVKHATWNELFFEPGMPAEPSPLVREQIRQRIADSQSEQDQA